MMETEQNKSTLQQAIDGLDSYEPSDQLWDGIEAGLKEFPLQAAVEKLPHYEPVEMVWGAIEGRVDKKNSSYMMWWLAAAMALIVSTLVFWSRQPDQPDQISYSREKVDSRLLVSQENAIDEEFEKLKTYCEAETLVCDSSHFKQLKEDYETLTKAADQLKQAMGEFNTEPELARQFAALEQEKADLLNEMAKMI